MTLTLLLAIGANWPILLAHEKKLGTFYLAKGNCVHLQQELVGAKLELL